VSGVSHQHDIAIALIVVFGIQVCMAVIYRLYKWRWLRITFSPGGGVLAAVGGVAIEDTSAADTRTAFAAMTDGLAALKADVKELNVSLGGKVDGVGTSVEGIRAQLDKAGHAAYFWNISSLLFGIAGVVLGVAALNLGHSPGVPGSTRRAEGAAAVPRTRTGALALGR
jgi:hypothetical protein